MQAKINILHALSNKQIAPAKAWRRKGKAWLRKAGRTQYRANIWQGKNKAGQRRTKAKVVQGWQRQGKSGQRQHNHLNSVNHLNQFELFNIFKGVGRGDPETEMRFLQFLKVHVVFFEPVFTELKYLFSFSRCRTTNMKMST